MCCMGELMAPYDLRSFFGGMTAYHDLQKMAGILGVKSAIPFTSNFHDASEVDPVMLAARIPKVDPSRGVNHGHLNASDYEDAGYCAAVRWCDALLWCALMQRPRRDVGIMNDTANTLARYCDFFTYIQFL